MSILDNFKKAYWNCHFDDALNHLSNVNAEQDFLSILINVPSILNEIEDQGIKLPLSSDFYNPKHGLLLEAIQEFVNKYGIEAFNVNTLHQFIDDNQEKFTLTIENKLYKADAQLLATCLINYHESLNDCKLAKRQIELIIDLSQRRKIHNLLIAAQNNNIDPNGKSAVDIAYGIQDEVGRVIDANSSGSIQHKRHTDVESAVKLFEKLQKEAETDTVDMGLPTGVKSIDNIIGGFLKGTFSILAARAGIGKTALACQIAYHNARAETQKRPIFIFSLEMTLAELQLRRFASVAKMNMTELKACKGLTTQYMAISRDIKRCDNKVSIYTDISSISPIEIRSALNSFIRTNDGVAPCLIIIDYLQLMTLKVNEPLAPQYAYAAYKDIARELKDIAKEYDLAVLALSQVSRSPNGKNELPTPELLRGSFGINDVSDLTIFLHCPDLKNKEEMIVSVAKNRNGSTGDTTVYYDAPHFTFYDK